MTTPRRTRTRLLSLAALAALLAVLLVSADLHSALAGPSGASASVTPPRALAEIEASIEAAASDATVPTAGLATAIAAALTEDQKLTASDGTVGAYFGFTVSLSGDRALVGAPFDGGEGAQSGSAYVFVFDGTAWTEQAKLTASDGAERDVFGASVSLSGDRALVGAYEDDDNGSASGSAYVFALDGTTWAQEAKLTASDGAAGDWFGFSVSLSGDRALVGAPSDDDNGFGSGSAYVFAFGGTSWVQQAKLTASDADGSGAFGASVSLSGDRALVGAYSEGGDGSGSAYVFASDGTAWTQQAKLTASDGAAGDWFGWSVSLSGERALVGAVSDGDNGLGSGSAYVFAFDGTAWVQEAKLTASDGAENGAFGISVSLSDGRALVGALYGGDNGLGSAYVFAFDGTAWVQEAKLTASDGAAGDYFGWSVSLSGERALVGAYQDDDNGAVSGSAYTFGLDSSNQPPVVVPGFSKAFDPSSIQAGQTSTITFTIDNTASSSAATDLDFTDDLPAGLVVAVGVNGRIAFCGLGTLTATGGAGTISYSGGAVPASTTCTISVDVTSNMAGVYVNTSGDLTSSAGNSGTASATLTVEARPNTQPVANAGDDQTVIAGQTVTLDGSRSSDDDRDDLTYDWALTGPGYTNEVALTGVSPTFCAAEATAPGSPYTTTLVVNDGTEDSELTDLAVVTVTALSVDAALDALVADVRALGDGDETDPLNGGQANALTVKLEQAQRKLGRGQDPADQLSGFRRQVRDLEAEGVLDPADADALVASVDAIADAVAAPCSAAASAAAPASVVAEDPADFGLEAPYPNPTNGRATVAFAVEETADVRLAVYDALGREVAVLVDRSVEAGRHEAVLDGRDLPTGTYLVRLTADALSATQRLTLLR